MGETLEIPSPPCLLFLNVMKVSSSNNLSMINFVGFNFVCEIIALFPHLSSLHYLGL